MIIDKGIRVIPSIGKLLDDRFVGVRAEFQKDLTVQSANIEGLVKGAFVQKSAVTTIQGKDVKTGDLLLDHLVRDVSAKQARVQELTDLAGQPDLQGDVREQVMARLKDAQVELATAVGDVTTRVVTQKVDVTTGGAADISSVLTGSLGMIRDKAAIEQLSGKLVALEDGASGSQRVLVGNLRLIGGFR